MASTSKRLPEKKIPVFSVFKDLSIIKNIFVLSPEKDDDDGVGKSTKAPERRGAGAEMEEVLTVGRHPDCTIVMLHPSVSRRHFQINVKASTHQLFVTDLNSVHGTWVSGRRIEPGVRVEIREGDTIVVGASTRVYRLNWVPLSRAYGMQSPSASAAMVEEREAMATPQREPQVKVREGLSSRIDSGGVAQKAASEEISCEEVSEMEEGSCLKSSGIKMLVLDEDSEVKMPILDEDNQVKMSILDEDSEVNIPVLDEDSEVKMPQVKEDAELQSKDSEEVFSGEKDDGVSHMLEEVRQVVSESQSDVHVSLDRSLPVIEEEEERSATDAIGETENLCLVKDSEQNGIPLIEGKTPEISHYEPFSVGKKEIGRLYRKNDEPVKVAELGIGSPACPFVEQEALPVIRHEETPLRSKSSYLKPTNSDSEPSMMNDEEHSETAAVDDLVSSLQQVLFSEEEGTMVPLRNDNELTEVSYLETGDSEYYSIKDSLAEGGNKDVSVLFQGESSEVANLYSSLLFAAVKSHLDREISLMKNREHLEAARLEVNVSLTVENLLQADQQQLSLEGNDETRSLSNKDGISELDCGSSPMKNQEGLETSLSELDSESSPMKNQEGFETSLSELDCESSSMKNQEGLETGLSELDSVNSSMVDKNLSITELHHISLVEKEDTEVTGVLNLSLSDESLLEAGLQLESLDEKEEISSLPSNDSIVTDEVTPALQTNLGDGESSLMKDLSEPNSVNLPSMIENLSEDDDEAGELPSLETGGSADLESEDGNEQMKYDEQMMSPKRYPIEDAVIKGGNKNGSADLASDTAEFDELTRSPEWDSAEDGPPKRSSIESLKTDISMEDFDSLMVTEATEADLDTSVSLKEDQEHLEGCVLESDSLNKTLHHLGSLSEANLQQGSFSNELTETSEFGAGSLVVPEEEELTFDKLNECSGGHSFEEASPMSSPLRSQMEVSDGADLDSIFLAAVQSDFNNKTPQKEDQRHLDMCIFDVESFSVSSKGDNQDTSAPIDQQNDSESIGEQNRGAAFLSLEEPVSKSGSTETYFSTHSTKDQEQKELGLVNHGSYIQESYVDGQEQKSSEEQKLEMQQLQDHSSEEKPQVYENGNIQEPLVDGQEHQSTEEQNLEIQQVQDHSSAEKLQVYESQEPLMDEQDQQSSEEQKLEMHQVQDHSSAEELQVYESSEIEELLVDGQEQQSTEEQTLEMQQVHEHSSAEKLQVYKSSNIQEPLVDGQEQLSTEEQTLETQQGQDHTSPKKAQDSENGMTTICSVSVVTESVTSSLSMEELLSEIMENEESTTPQSVLSPVKSLEDRKSESVKLVKRTSVQRIWLRKGEPASAVQLRKSKSMGTISTDNGDAEAGSSHYKEKLPAFAVSESTKEFFIPDKENQTPNTHFPSGIRSNAEAGSSPYKEKLPAVTVSESMKEIFIPDMENQSPNTHFPSGTRGKLEELKSSSLSPKITVTSKILAEREKESSTPEEIHQQRIATSPTAGNNFKLGLGLQLVLRDRMAEKMPLQNLIIRSPVLSFSRASLGSASTGTPGSAPEQSSVNSTKGRKKRWIMVVDTISLLDNDSRKSLQLLQGLRGTQLIIPGIVKSELDSLKTTGRLFRRTTEAAKVLEWIEDCKKETAWWIHVQSSVEVSPLSTPPAASPEFGPVSKRWYSPFSAEMPSPRPEDHVLSTALLYKKLCHDGKQLVLISHDDSLKVKAMAEGLICETAQEFRCSLVNPFSERFLWAESSPRGQTWSVKDDVDLKERFYQSPERKQLSRAETAKGLKLVLLDESRNGFPVESIRTVFWWLLLSI
ncbi:FHA domain-containing protein PS1 [Linum perenne]